MIYEVYQLLDKKGANKFIGRERSLRKAFTHCHAGQLFMIAERIRKNTDVCGLTVVLDGYGIGAIMMLPQYGNIIRNAADAEKFWSTRQSYFRDVL